MQLQMAKEQIYRDLFFCPTSQANVDSKHHLHESGSKETCFCFSGGEELVNNSKTTGKHDKYSRQICTSYGYNLWRTKQECLKIYHLWLEVLFFLLLALLAAKRAVEPTVVGRNDLCHTILQCSGSFVFPSYLIHWIISWYMGKNLIWIAEYEK